MNLLQMVTLIEVLFRAVNLLQNNFKSKAKEKSALKFNRTTQGVRIILQANKLTINIKYVFRV